MKRYIRRIAIFMATIVFLLNIAAIFILSSKNKFSNSLSWYWVYEMVLKSKTRMPGNIAYFGDSLGEQVFPVWMYDNSVAVNGAVLTSGQYLLAKNIIQNNPQVDTLYFVISPMTIGYPFERNKTTNNFIKPFLTFDNLKYLDSTIVDPIKKYHLFDLMYLFKGVKLLPLSEYSYGNHQPKYRWLSEFSVVYLQRIYELCKQSDVVLHVISPPISEDQLNEYRTIESLQLEIEQNGLQDILPVYANSIKVLQRECFSADKFHYTKEYIAENRAAIKNTLLKPLNE